MVDNTKIVYGIINNNASKNLLFRMFIYNKTTINTSKSAGGFRLKKRHISDKITRALENLTKKRLFGFCGDKFLSEI